MNFENNILKSLIAVVAAFVMGCVFQHRMELKDLYCNIGNGENIVEL